MARTHRANRPSIESTTKRGGSTVSDLLSLPLLPPVVYPSGGPHEREVHGGVFCGGGGGVPASVPRVARAPPRGPRGRAGPGPPQAPCRPPPSRISPRGPRATAH